MAGSYYEAHTAENAFPRGRKTRLVSPANEEARPQKEEREKFSRWKSLKPGAQTKQGAEDEGLKGGDDPDLTGKPKERRRNDDRSRRGAVPAAAGTIDVQLIACARGAWGARSQGLIAIRAHPAHGP